MGMCEVRWTGAGFITSDEYTVIYSGGHKHERGVGILLDEQRSKCLIGYWTISDRIMLVKLKGKPFDISIIQVYAPTANKSEEEHEQFYNDLEMAKSQCKSQDMVIVIGDFNAKVGDERYEDTVRPHGLGNRNERGEKLIEWAKSHGMIIGNTWFEQHPRRLWTWKSPGDNTRNQIDYILINSRFRNALLVAKTFPGADCGSDHVPVCGTIRLKLKKIKSAIRNIKLDVDTLRSDSDIKEKFTVAVKNRFSILHDVQEVDEKWEHLKESITQAAEETIPKSQRKAKKKWMNDEILKMMDERRKSKQDRDAYDALNKQITTKCNEAKEKWLNEQCDDIEKNHKHDSKSMHARIREISGKRICSAPGCLKSREGNIIIEKEKILERWSEYISELYHDERGDKPPIMKNFDGPPIMKDEVRKAVKSMKKGKAAGPDKITVEMIESLDEFGIDMLTDFLNAIYDTGDIPSDLSKSIQEPQNVNHTVR